MCNTFQKAFLGACTMMLERRSTSAKCSSVTVDAKSGGAIVTFIGTAKNIELLVAKEREDFPTTKGRVATIGVARNDSLAENSYLADNGGNFATHPQKHAQTGQVCAFH